ncbi:MAG: homoserine kinase [Actinomycetota bacterium]|nr:homoserine kinase [Actinomycetota bacterium]
MRAPASTANLGAGFDCAGAALDLWNELELHEGGGETAADHLAVRAFARLASPDGFAFTFTERIPRARGLGSSAATIALGLLAGAAVAGRATDSEELLALGLDLEGHPDNLAAALTGGVCLTWEGRVVRIADDAPGVPIAIVPRNVTVETHAARAALPETIAHADAAFSIARAVLLGAAVASGSADLFAAAADDRLHEPYRAPQAPALAAVREQLPDGALGATLSGSGPTVIVWARPESAAACAAELAKRFSDTDVLHLSISPTGAGRL